MTKGSDYRRTIFCVVSNEVVWWVNNNKNYPKLKETHHCRTWTTATKTTSKFTTCIGGENWKLIQKWMYNSQVKGWTQWKKRGNWAYWRLIESPAMMLTAAMARYEIYRENSWVSWVCVCVSENKRVSARVYVCAWVKIREISTPTTAIASHLNHCSI